MEKFTYRTLEISGSRENIQIYLDREYMIWPKDSLDHYQYEFINIIRGISNQLKGILYYRRECNVIPEYEKMIQGLIHEQLINDNLNFYDPTPHSGRGNDDNYLESFWFESRIIHRSETKMVIAYILDKGVDTSFWKRYLADVHPLLSFTHYETELTRPIPYYKSMVIYNHGCEIDDEDYPEDFLLSDLDLV
jgi:hypothetical protein